MSVNPRRYGDIKLIIELIKTNTQLVDHHITYSKIIQKPGIFSADRKKIKNSWEKGIKELRADNITLAVEIFRRLYLRKKIK